MTTPLHIQKKRKGWYYDLPNDKWVKGSNLKAYLDKKSVDPKVKDEAIRKQRFDLNY